MEGRFLGQGWGGVPVQEWRAVSSLAWETTYEGQCQYVELQGSLET